jgi:hypothetical protein
MRRAYRSRIKRRKTMTRTTKIGLLVMTLLLATAGQASADAAHSAPTQCLGFIQPNEVRVYLQTGYVGPCYSLFMGTTDPWTAYDVTYGFPNDAVRSVKVGSNVSVTLFWNSLYTGDNGAVFTVPASFGYSDMGSWNARASAARVQSWSPYTACSGSGDFIALFTDGNYGGDCNKLTVGARCYSDPIEMGFRTDTLSSWRNASGVFEPNLYIDFNFQRLWGGVFPLSQGNMVSLGNDRISSMSGDDTRACPF